MILCLNTAVPPHHVAIANEKKTVSEFLKKNHESETILSTIDRLLKREKTKLKDLTGVAVVTGPGGFTSLRVGVTIANTFADQLKIPIFGITTEEWQKSEWANLVQTRFIASRLNTTPLEPHYGRPPTITPSKTASMRPPQPS